MSFIPESVREWFTNPGFVQYVKHAYWIGGYEVVSRGTLQLDDDGLDWVRTLNLRDRKYGIEFRIIDPQDLSVIIGPYPSEDQVIAMYGKPVWYEHEAYAEFLKLRRGR